jgi:hypothetical protein
MAGKSKGNGYAMANGQATVNGMVTKLEEEIYQEENIFLFLPNIIGMSPRVSASSAAATNLCKVTFVSSSRSHHCITCLCTHGRVPACTVSPVYSMRRTA